MATLTFVQRTDEQLRAELPRLVGRERAATVELVACLAEFDRRRLFLEMGFSSIYAYCAACLHLTEGAAYRRIEVARAARRFPAVLDMLREGELSLATAALVGPKLTPANADHWLKVSAFKSKRDVERLLAQFNPQPPVPSTIRKLPEPKPVVAPASSCLDEVSRSSEAGDDAVVAAAPSTSESVPGPVESRAPVAPAAGSTCLPPSRRSIVAPLSEAHYKLQVTISAAARERLGQIQALMRHRVPSGDPAAIIERALEVLHADLLKQKAAQVAKPRTGRTASEAKGRYIPAAVKREVWRRDHGRCAFIAPDGCRCRSEETVEFHHVQPYAVGGDATVDNIELRCRAHNGFEWQRHIDLETLSLAGQPR